MNILVDDALAYAEQALGCFGAELCLIPGRAIEPTLAELRDAEVLIVRSVTKVDARLLDAAPRLRLVGTATAGIDHLDRQALAERGVDFVSAPGCNAQAVAEWVVAALIDLGPCLPDALARGPIGIVGCGEVGSRLARLLRRLGWSVICCDPPRARRGELDEGAAFVSLDELWARCPIVSLHVPLERASEDGTYALIDRDAPALAGPKLLINTSRGAVVPDRALDRPDLHMLVLDVFEHEPALRWDRLADPRLVRASPHVAGYSLEGKLRATAAMHEAVARLVGQPPCWTGAEHLPELVLAPDQQAREVDRPSSDPWTTLQTLVGQVTDLAGDDARVRALVELPEHERPAAFEQLRRRYLLRREFASGTLEVTPDPALAGEVRLGPSLLPVGEILRRLGVRVG